MITKISNFNSKNVAFSASPIKATEKVLQKGAKLGEKVTNTFQISKHPDTPKGLSSKPIRFEDGNFKSPPTSVFDPRQFQFAIKISF